MRTGGNFSAVNRVGQSYDSEGNAFLVDFKWEVNPGARHLKKKKTKNLRKAMAYLQETPEGGLESK